MEELCKELDDVKAQLAKLTAESRIKTEQFESLKKANNEQLTKIKEAKLEIEKQAQELSVHEEELSVLKQMNEELKSKLNEKESALRHLGSAKDKLRADLGEKLHKLELANRELALALDEANIEKEDQQKTIRTSKEEIEGLKGLLSKVQKKYHEAEQRALLPQELRRRDDHMLKLEEEEIKIRDQLKWKKEQFEHLEQAHEKVKGQFKASKKEWEREKAKLIDDICLLQKNLDSQTRVSESLRNQLQMCNQALAQEESRRKLLELEISDSKKCYENVFTDYQEARSEIESLTARRDEEIAALRYLLGTKESHFKEAEYRQRQLEEENQDLIRSLKELQEAQIKEAGSASVSSLNKLRNKLRSLEQVHKECSANLRAREVEWDLRMEEVVGDLSHCKSELRHKDKQIQKLQMELEACHSSIMQLKLENEEISVMLMVLRSGVSESHSKLFDSSYEMEHHQKETVKKIRLLMEQLEQNSGALFKAHAEIEHERKRTESLLRKIDSLNHVQEKYILMQQELERYKEMLEIQKNERVEKINLLLEELEQKNSDLLEAHAAIEQEREKAELLLKKTDLADHVEKQYHATQKELERYKEMLEFQKEEAVEKINLLLEELEQKNSDLLEAHAAIEQEREKAELLLKKTDLADHVEKQYHATQKELERYKEMLEFQKEEAVENIALLTEQLEQKNSALLKTHMEIEQEREKAELLSRKLDSADQAEEKYALIQKELEKYKKMLEDLSGKHLCLKEQAVKRENALKDDLRKVSDDLDKANTELTEKTLEGNEIEFELESWKSFAERLKSCLDENQEMRREMEASLLSQIEAEQTLKQEMENLQLVAEEKGQRAEDLQHQIVLLEQELIRRESEAALVRKEIESQFEEGRRNLLQSLEEKQKRIDDLEQQIAQLEQEFMTRELEAAILTQIKAEKIQSHFEEGKRNSLQTLEEKEKRIDDLQIHIAWLEQESMTRELEAAILTQLQTEKILDREKERLLQVVEKKDLIIQELQVKCLELEQNITSKVEIDALCRALEKTNAAMVLKEIEIQEKNLVINDLEEQNTNLWQDQEQLERSLSSSQKHGEDLQEALEAKQLEMDEVTGHLQNKLRASRGLIEKLTSEKNLLVEDIMKLSLEREQLLVNIEGLCDKISEFSNEDTELMGRLGGIVQSFDEGIVQGTETQDFDEHCNIENGNLTIVISPLAKRLEVNADGRSPLKERNN